MDRYVLGDLLGEGTYAKVFKAYLKEDTKKLYPLALKRTKPDKEDKKIGIHIDAIREVYALRRANHPNVLKLYDVFIESGFTNLVYEYLDVSLDKIIRNNKITEAQGKTYFKMLTEAVNYIHNTLHILHLDIGPRNLLIAYNPDTHESTLKLADFGLSYPYGAARTAMARYQDEPLSALTSPPELMEPTAITITYRAPELLYGATQYGPATDMWSCGCVFAEMFFGRPLFPGSPSADIRYQKDLIKNALGTPREEVWNGFSSLETAVAQQMQIQQQQQQQQQYVFKRVVPVGRTVVKGKGLGLPDWLHAKTKKVITLLLSYDPAKRLTASGLLRSDYFKEGCCPTNELPFQQ